MFRLLYLHCRIVVGFNHFRFSAKHLHLQFTRYWRLLDKLYLSSPLHYSLSRLYGFPFTDASLTYLPIHSVNKLQLYHYLQINKLYYSFSIYVYIKLKIYTDSLGVIFSSTGRKVFLIFTLALDTLHPTHVSSRINFYKSQFWFMTCM